MSQGPQGPPGVVIPGIEFSQLAVDEDGNVYLDAITHYGITAEGVGYYEDDPDLIPEDERAWPVWDPVNSRMIISTDPLSEGGTGNAEQVATDLAAHTARTTSVHGITNTADLATDADVDAKINIHNSATAAHGLDIADIVLTDDARLTDSRPPTGSAGGVLGGMFPNPTFAADMATQAELDAHAADSTNVHGVADMAQLATVSYVDSVSQGNRPKDPVELVTTTNHSLSGLAAIDGVTPSAGWRILIAGQSSAAADGLYIAASGAWARATDLDATAELIAGITVYVKQGSTKANTQWVLTFSGTANLGTTAQTWTQSGAGSIPSDADAATPSLRSLGTGATQALPGNHASTTNTRTPTDGTVTAAKFATNADIPQEQIARLTTDLETKAPTTPRLWLALGEPGVGGYNTTVRVSRANPHHILAGGDELGIAVWNGRTGRWYTPRGVTNNEINDIVQHPTQLNVWWAATMGGALRSLDGGYTWERCVSGMPTSGQEYFRAVGKILFDPTNDDRAYAIAGSHRPWKTSNSDVSNYGQVYISTNINDETPTWTLHSTVATDAVVRGAAIASDGLTMLAVGSFGVSKWTSASGVWSTAGITGLPGGSSVPLDVVAHPVTTNVFIVAVEQSGGTGGGVYRTTNSAAFTAATGLPSTSTDGYRKLDISLSNPNVVIVTGRSTDKAHKSTDNGVSFVDYMTNADKPADAGNPAGVGGGDGIGIDPADANHIVIGTSDEIYQSFGSGWTSLGSRGLSGGRLRGRGYSGYVTEHINPSRARKNHFLLHTFDAGNTMFTDDLEGFTFPTRSLYTYGGAYGSCFAGPDGSKAYAILGQSGTFRGIAISSDYGRTFPTRVYGSGVGLPELDSVNGIGRAAIAPLNPSGTALIALIGGIAYRSTNSGASWSQVGDTGLKLETLAVDESTMTTNGLGTTIYMGDPTTGRGVYKSTDSGSNFSLISNTPHADNTSGGVFLSFCQITRRLYVTIWQPTSSIAAAQQGVWRLEGSTWTRIFDNFSAKKAAPSWHDPNLIAVATHDSPRWDVNRATGVWLSENNGDSFAQVNNGLPVTNVRVVAWDPFDAGRLIIGTEGRGFWTTKVSAEDFTAAATAIPDGALAESQIEGLAETLAVVPSSAEVARFRNTDSLHELAAIQQQIATVVRARDLGYAPDYRVSTLPRTSLSNDLTITSGDLYLFRLILFKDFWAKKLRWSVGKSTALGGATLARFGIYEQGADLGMTLRAATATTHTTAFQTTGSTETAPLSTGGSLPRTYLLRYGTEYYFAGLVVGTLTNGSWRGCDLNGTGLLEPVAAYRVTGQTDLPATIAAGSLTSTDRLGWGAVE